MIKDVSLKAEEKIMDAVCEQCHWPYAYRGEDEEAMYAEKCENCPAALAVQQALTSIGRDGE